VRAREREKMASDRQVLAFKKLERCHGKGQHARLARERERKKERARERELEKKA